MKSERGALILSVVMSLVVGAAAVTAVHLSPRVELSAPRWRG